jgi:hypothetical protein
MHLCYFFLKFMSVGFKSPSTSEMICTSGTNLLFVYRMIQSTSRLTTDFSREKSEHSYLNYRAYFAVLAYEFCGFCKELCR